MKFEFKKQPVSRDIIKALPQHAGVIGAFKVRPKGEDVIGGVVGFKYGPDNKEGWVYIREGKVYGGFTSRHDAAEGLAKS